MFKKPPVLVSDFSDINEIRTEIKTGTPTMTVEAASANGGTGIFHGQDSVRVLMEATASGDKTWIGWDCNVQPLDSERFLVRFFQPVGWDSELNPEDWSIGFAVGNIAGDSDSEASAALFQLNSAGKAQGNTLIFSRADFTTDYGGGVDWDLPILTMWLEIRKKVQAGDVEVILDSVWSGWQLAGGIPVAFSMDDCDNDIEAGPKPVGQYDYLWLEVFKPRGWRFTLAVTLNSVDAANSLTTAQIVEMQRAGNDVIWHGVTHDDYFLTSEGGDFATAALIEADIHAWRSWAESLDLQRGRSEKWAAWPNGNFSETTIATFDAAGFSKYRLAGGGFETNYQWNYFPLKSDGFRDFYDKEVISAALSSTTAASDTAADILAAVDSAIAKQVPVCFFSHVFPTTPSAGREFAYAEAETLWAGLDTREAAGTVRVVQLTELDATGGASGDISSRHTRARRIGNRAR